MIQPKDFSADSQRAPIAIDREALIERFLRYVKVETTANPDDPQKPSSPGQIRLGELVATELIRLGLADVRQEPGGVVYATIPASRVEYQDRPAIAWIAHLDTSPEASGANVQPRRIDDYDGQPITLESGEVVEPQSVDASVDWIGKTLIVTDGKTLLGGDDKAGVAIIVQTAATLIQRRDLSHGPIRLVLTCDEEIGRGTESVDLSKIDATVGYTIDGGGAGVIDVETFSADGMTVHFTGRNIHPSIAKGRMINSLRAASEFVASLPTRDTTPETTDGREGFIHVYDVRGSVQQTSVKLILRSFETADLDRYARQIIQLADDAADSWPGTAVSVDRVTQYRNMAEGLRRVPQCVTLAEQAFERLGRPYRTEIIRGGTDGSQLTALGLPTPNLSSGQYNIHSTGEFVCVEDMVAAAEHLVALAALWAERGGA